MHEPIRQTLAELRRPQNVQGSDASSSARAGQGRVEQWGREKYGDAVRLN